MMRADIKDVKTLSRFFKRGPDLAVESIVLTLNDLAFSTRRDLIETIGRNMHIRDQRFVNGRMQVQKARGRNISRAVAEVGSVNKSRFTGWVEQETGEPDERERTYSVHSRGGAEANRVQPSRSRKRSNDVLKMSDFNLGNAKNQTHRAIIFMQIIDRKHRNKMFFLPKDHGKLLGNSVYLIGGRRRRKTRRAKATGGALRRVSRDHTMRTGKQPWMQPTLRGSVSKSLIRERWAHNVNKSLLRRLK